MAKARPETKSYDRQPGETARAFEAFTTYLQLGDERSYTKTAQALHKNRTSIGKWGRKYHWQDRLADYQIDMAREAREQAKKDRDEMHQRQISMAKLFQKKAYDALKNLNEEELTPALILRFFSIGADIERTNQEDVLTVLARETGDDGEQENLIDAIVEAFSGDDKE